MYNPDAKATQRHVRLKHRSHAATAATANPSRSKKRLALQDAVLNSAPGTTYPSGATHRAGVVGHLGYEGGSLALPLELDARDAIALGAALIAAGVDALGTVLPSAVRTEQDGDAVIRLAEALDALRGPRL